MGVMLCQVNWSGKATTGETVSLSFDDIESIDISMKSDNSANTARIVLKNWTDRLVSGFSQPFARYVTNTNNIFFNEGDTIKIYGAYVDDYRALDTTTTGSADLIMTGEISEVNIKGSEKGAKITLSVTDKTYVLLNRVHTYPYLASNSWTAPLIVQDTIRAVSDVVDSDPLSYDASGNYVENGLYSVDARLVSAGSASLPAYIEDTRIDGSAFPTLSMSKIAKPAYEWIKELSTIDSTNDFTGGDDEDAPTQNRNMLFYVDELNRFHWYYPQDNLTTTLNGGITATATTITLTNASLFPTNGTIFIGTERIDYIGKSSNDLTNCTRGANNTTAAAHTTGSNVRTADVFTEGDTSTGNIIQSFNITKKTFDIVNFVIFNCGSDLYGNGITSFFFDKTTKSKTLKDTFKPYEEISKDLFEDEITAGNLIQDDTQTDFVYKGHYYKDKGYNFATSWGVTVTSNDSYNDAFRDQAIKLGAIKAQKLTQKRGSPRWKGSIDTRFKRYKAGDLLEFTSTRAGINEQSLRIMSVKLNIRNNGGFASLTVEEDEDKLGAT